MFPGSVLIALEKGWGKLFIDGFDILEAKLVFRVCALFRWVSQALYFFALVCFALTLQCQYRLVDAGVQLMLTNVSTCIGF